MFAFALALELEPPRTGAFGVGGRVAAPLGLLPEQGLEQGLEFLRENGFSVRNFCSFSDQVTNE